MIAKRAIPHRIVLSACLCSFQFALTPSRALAQRVQGSISDRPSADSSAHRFIRHKLRPWERFTYDFRLWDNAPGFSRGDIRINRWGMRDREYEPAARAGYYRFGLLGASMTLGARVPIEQTMKSVLEDHLNKEGLGPRIRRFEVLNFSVGAYSALQQVAVMERTVPRLKPDAILLGVFSVEIGRMTDYLAQLVRTRYPVPYPFVSARIASTGARPDMEDPELFRRLGSISPELVTWSYRRILTDAKRNGIPVVGLLLPEPRPRPRRRPYGDLDQAASAAAAAGIPLLDLRNMYAGQNIDSLRLGGIEGSDPHWNARGHTLAGDKVYQLLRQNEAKLFPAGRQP